MLKSLLICALCLTVVFSKEKKLDKKAPKKDPTVIGHNWLEMHEDNFDYDMDDEIQKRLQLRSSLTQDDEEEKEAKVSNDDLLDDVKRNSTESTFHDQRELDDEDDATEKAESHSGKSEGFQMSLKDVVADTRRMLNIEKLSNDGEAANDAPNEEYSTSSSSTVNKSSLLRQINDDFQDDTQDIEVEDPVEKFQHDFCERLREKVAKNREKHYKLYEQTCLIKYGV